MDEDFAPGELESLIAEGEANLAAHGPINADEVFEELRRMSRECHERRNRDQ